MEGVHDETRAALALTVQTTQCRPCVQEASQARWAACQDHKVWLAESLGFEIGRCRSLQESLGRVLPRKNWRKEVRRKKETSPAVYCNARSVNVELVFI